MWPLDSKVGPIVKKIASATTSTPIKTSKRTLDTPEKASLPWRKSKSVRINRRFHGRRRHLSSGANTAKFTVNVWENS